MAAALLPETEAADESAGGVAATRIPLAGARLVAMGGDLERARADLEAVSPAPAPTARSDARQAELFHAELLLALDDHEALQPLVTTAVDAAQRAGQVGCARSWRRLHARLLLRRGRLAEAEAMLAGELDGDAAAATPDDARALLTMCELAIHAGDDRRTKELAGIAERAVETGGPAVRRLAAWLLALPRRDVERPRRRSRLAGPAGPGARRRPAAGADARADGGAPPGAHGLVGRARRARRGGGDDDGRPRPSQPLRTAPSPPPRRTAAGSSSTIPTRWPRRPSTSAARRCPSREASALEDLGVELARRPSAGSAVEAFDGALRRYAQCGASWDASRVRRRLRELGVRRRLVAPSRPTNGWGSLTVAELAVVRLVADGLTNRAVARQLFLSSHTVSMHLRHVFVKLGINSRVELTRLAVDHDIA